MPTLYQTLQSLYEVQQLDTQIARLRRAQNNLDTGTQAAQEARAARDAANAKKAQLHRLQTDLKDSELKLKTVEDKRKSYHDRLYQGSITNPKELGNIEREIAALGRQRGDLDERILELMDQVEQAQASAVAAEEEAHAADSKHQDIMAAYQSRHAALDLELQEASRKRGELASLIEDKALLKRYEDTRAKAGGIGIAKIEDGSCGGCHMSLPSSVIAAVKDYAAPQRCENCGRLLVT